MINILQHDGLLNKSCSRCIWSRCLVWLSTDSAMYLGIVYSYLPFMIWRSMRRSQNEPALLEAAAIRFFAAQAFWR